MLSYQKEVEEYAWSKKRQAIYSFLKKIDGERKLRLLDVGCNNGGQLIEYSKLLNGYFIGLDVKKFNEWKSLSFDFLLGDARKLPFKNEVFDIVIATEVIEHFVDGEAFVSEAYRVLRRGGLLLITTPNALRFYMLHKRLIAKVRGEKIVSGHTHEHPREYTAGELQKMLEEVGFHIEHIDYIAFSPYLRLPIALFKIADKISDRILKRYLKWDIFIAARKF